MDKMVDAVDALKARWMTGGSAAGLGPVAWQGKDDLSLLVLAGQFTRIATRPSLDPAPRPRPDIPEVPLAPLPEELRPLFRRLLSEKLAQPIDVVRLIAARGYCVNPVDWMPARGDTDVPAPYLPWVDWLDGVLPSEASAELTAETWDDASPNRRHRDLERLHREAPEAARALITKVAPTLAADRRLRMLDCLRPGLTAADAPLLETFRSDRSGKVKAWVRTQLARLGTAPETDAEAAAEISDYVALAKAGILSRKKVITSPRLKTNAQRARRAQVFSNVSLAGLAKVLDLDPDAVIETWAFEDATDDFLALVAASGTDAQVYRLTERAVAQGIFVPTALRMRLDDATRLTFGLRAMASGDVLLEETRAWITAPDGRVGWAEISTAKELIKLIERPPDSETRGKDVAIGAALAFLGLLADRDAATRLLDRLTAAGLLTVDPRLTLLRLNAAL